MAYLNQLAKVILGYKSEKEIINFLEAILTPKELDEIPKRLQIIRMLKMGTPQREISQKLKVGIGTVTRGSRELQKGSFEDID